MADPPREIDEGIIANRLFGSSWFPLLERHVEPFTPLAEIARLFTRPYALSGLSPRANETGRVACREAFRKSLIDSALGVILIF